MRHKDNISKGEHLIAANIQSEYVPDSDADAFVMHPVASERYSARAYQGVADVNGDKEASKGNLVKVFVALGGVLLLGAIAFLVWLFMMPIHVTVNDVDVTLYHKKTIQGAIEGAHLDISPGDLVDIEGVVLKAGKGDAYACIYNGKDIGGQSHLLLDGDTIVVQDGTDIEEPFTLTERKTAGFSEREAGFGSVRTIIQNGKEGLEEVKTGEISKKEIVTEKQAPEDKIYAHVWVDVHDEKVIALTFDDGPWPHTTNEILDVLKEYDVKATFFVIGNQIHDDGAESVKRAHAEGHQVATHSFSHASGSGKGVDLSLMSTDERKADVQKGLESIEQALGEKPSPILRAPGGNFALEVWKDVEGMIDAEIGWDIDTEDWRRPGISSIESSIKRATPGDIILMHDGGGDRSQTVEALKKAIPYLKDQGYTFVTIDELLQYGYKEQDYSK